MPLKASSRSIVYICEHPYAMCLVNSVFLPRNSIAVAGKFIIKWSNVRSSFVSIDRSCTACFIKARPSMLYVLMCWLVIYRTDEWCCYFYTRVLMKRTLLSLMLSHSDSYEAGLRSFAYTTVPFLAAGIEKGPTPAITSPTHQCKSWVIHPSLLFQVTYICSLPF